MYKNARKGINMIKVSIVGITGYSGLELLKLLHFHPKVELVKICATSNIGKKLSDVYAQFEGLSNLTIEEFNAQEIMNSSECVFFATSAGVTSKIALELIEHDFPVIDLSGDFRLKEEQIYEKWYKNTTTKNEYLSKSDYVLADLNQPISKYIANPGCYATATLLALAPLVQNNLVKFDSIVVDAKSGLSGAGKSLTDSSHFVNVQENMTMYKIDGHQHIPEIVQQAQIWNENFGAIQFQTSLIPVTRGIFVAMYAKLSDSVTFDDIKSAYHALYDDKAFVRIRRQMPSLKDVAHTNFCDIGMNFNEETGFLTVVSVIDNLIKGAAGQAVQNFNHLFEFDEKTGLQFLPEI